MDKNRSKLKKYVRIFLSIMKMQRSALIVLCYALISKLMSTRIGGLTSILQVLSTMPLTVIVRASVIIWIKGKSKL
jgi:hypothetical protein